MLGRYLVGILIAIDILANALTGGERYQTISCRIGESIQAGGFWSRVPLPSLARQHFINAVHQATV